MSVVLAAFPPPVGYVNDFAGILTDRQTLENELSLYEKNTTIEIAIATIDSLPADQTAATYVVELFQDWGIGKKGEDNGILVLIVKNGTIGNRMRIELGYGIQGYITGAEAGRILDAALPYFEQKDFQKTADIIVAGLKEQLTSYQPGKPGPRSGASFGVINGLIFLFQIFPLLFFLAAIGIAIYVTGRCPYCRSRKIECEGEYCKCKKCGRRFKRKRSTPIFAAGGFAGGGGFGGGGGGFGGGGSGGGGAGR